jgi:hypothetical protein
MWLKYVRGRIVKPYNSALGEQFKAYWDVVPVSLDENGEPRHFDGVVSSDPPLPPPTDLPPSLNSLKPASDTDITSITSAASNLAVNDVSGPSSLPSSTPASHPPSIKSTFTADTSVWTSPPSDGPPAEDRHRVVFLNEQVSHHPPISCFWYESQSGTNGSRRVQACGVDQISAKFTGTSIKVCAGSQNQGVFIRLPERGEEYQVGSTRLIAPFLLDTDPQLSLGDTPHGVDHRYFAWQPIRHHLRSYLYYGSEREQREKAEVYYQLS